ECDRLARPGRAPETTTGASTATARRRSSGSGGWHTPCHRRPIDRPFPASDRPGGAQSRFSVTAGDVIDNATPCPGSAHGGLFHPPLPSRGQPSLDRLQQSVEFSNETLIHPAPGTPFPQAQLQIHAEFLQALSA